MLLPPLRPAICLSRENRFTATVREDGRVYAAHIPSSGRLGELIYPGGELWVADAAGTSPVRPSGGIGPRRPSRRKKVRLTAATVYLAKDAGHLVCIHTGLTNGLAVEAWRNGLLPELAFFREYKREVTVGKPDRRL